MVRHGLAGRRTPLAATALLLVSGVLAACSSDPAPAPAPAPSTSAAVETTELSLGVYGTQPEVEAFRGVVDTYTSSVEGVEIELRAYPDADRLAAAVLDEPDPPDVFLLTRADLEDVTAAGRNTPLLELVDERGVDFGDGYSRDAVLAFSATNDQQCMPYGISPMVIYYNTALVDLPKMTERGLDVPVPDEDTGVVDRWTLDQFRAAAQFASRPRRGTKGVHVDPTLRGLASFIYSGGGDLFDDALEPTSLDFSSDGTREALLPTLELLRDPALTLTEDQLAAAPAIEWFKRGKLGMIAGFRSATPQLRAQEDLDFDVLPMPMIDDEATVGDLSGMCISSETQSLPAAADFLVYLISAEAVARVTSAGYLVPANLEVAASTDFLQPDQRPAHAQVFNASIRAMRVLPLIDSYEDLEAAVAAPLQQLFTMPVPDIEGLTTQIDEQSRTVLDPELDPELDPTLDGEPSESAPSE